MADVSERKVASTVPEFDVESWYFGLYIVTLNRDPTGAKAAMLTSATLLSSMGRRSVTIGCTLGWRCLTT
jgi:hypothetical protein